MYQNTISPALTKQIHQICDDCDISLTTDYSGRGMYGKTCFGLIYGGSVGQLCACFLRGLDDDTMDEMADLFDEMRTDSMGYDTIYYFPGWTLDEDEDSEDDEDWDDEETDE